MYIVFAIAGLIAGIFIAESLGHFGFSAFTGAVFGIVLARLIKLDRRLRQLESSGQRTAIQPASAWGKSSAAVATVTPEPEPGLESSEAEAESATPWDSGPSGEEIFRQSREDESQTTRADDRGRGEPSAELGPSLLQTITGKVSDWFTSGNVPVKVGVIISFIGVAFLLKYAVDRRLVVISLEFRLLAVAAAGIAMLAGRLASA